MAFEVSGVKRAVRPAMNVTPLVDVVLVLLIIFMVGTPLLAKQVTLQVPPKEKADEPTPPPDAPAPVVLTVAKDGTFSINREPIPADELVEKVRRTMAARSDRVLFFDAADDCPYGRAMEALD